MWARRPTVSAPPARADHAMAYDPARQRTVLFGGRVAPTGADDTWEWDGTAWTRLFPTESPPPTYDHAMAYDSARQRMVVFSGSDTWLFLP